MRAEKKGDCIMEDKIIVVTARQAAKMFPRDKEVFRRAKALQDADIEPYIDEDSPELPDLEPKKRESIFTNILNYFRSRSKAGVSPS